MILFYLEVLWAHIHVEIVTSNKHICFTIVVELQREACPPVRQNKWSEMPGCTVIILYLIILRCCRWVISEFGLFMGLAGSEYVGDVGMCSFTGLRWWLWKLEMSVSERIIRFWNPVRNLWFWNWKFMLSPAFCLWMLCICTVNDISPVFQKFSLPY